MQRVLTEKQFEMAYRLAKQHGHEWAALLSESSSEEIPKPPAPAQTWTLDLIAALMAASGKPSAGIDCPTMDKHQVITHESATGRVRWWITRDGVVDVDIFRPEGKAATLHVGEDVWVNRFPGIVLFERHIQALRKCAVVLGAWEAIEPTVARWELGRDMTPVANTPAEEERRNV